MGFLDLYWDSVSLGTSIPWRSPHGTHYKSKTLQDLVVMVVIETAL